MSGRQMLESLLTLANSSILESSQICSLFELYPLYSDHLRHLSPSVIPPKPALFSLFFLENPSNSALKSDSFSYRKRKTRNNRGILETTQRLRNCIRVKYASVEDPSVSISFQRRVYTKLGCSFAIVHYVPKRAKLGFQSKKMSQISQVKGQEKEILLKVIPDFSLSDTETEIFLILSRGLLAKDVSVYFGEEERSGLLLNPYCIQTKSPYRPGEEKVKIKIRVDKEEPIETGCYFDFKRSSFSEKFDRQLSFLSTNLENKSDLSIFNFAREEMDFEEHPHPFEGSINEEIRESQKQVRAVKIQSKFRAWRDRKNFKLIRKSVSKIQKSIRKLKETKNVHG